MLAILAIAASLLAAQPFSMRLEAVDATGQETTFTSGRHFADRASCETAAAAERNNFAGMQNRLVSDGQVYRVAAIYCAADGQQT